MNLVRFEPGNFRVRIWYGRLSTAFVFNIMQSFWYVFEVFITFNFYFVKNMKLVGFEPGTCLVSNGEIFFNIMNVEM